MCMYISSGLYMMQTESQKLIVLHVIQDDLLEGNETFTIQLVSTGDAEISPVNGKELITFSFERFHTRILARLHFFLSTLLVYFVCCCLVAVLTASLFP